MLPALHVFNIDGKIYCIRVCMRRIFAPGQARQNGYRCRAHNILMCHGNKL